VKIKLIAVCISSLTIACASYASSNTIGSTSSTVQSQIADLKAQVTDLEKNKEKALGKSIIQLRNNTDQKPTLGSSLQVLDVDTGKNSLPFGLMPSYQYPLALLKARNNYSNNSLVFGGYVQSSTKGFWGKYIEYGSNKSKYTSGYGTYITTGRIYLASNLGRYIQTDLTVEGSQSTNPLFKEAFITFGNLAYMPFYATIGKTRMYLGKFSGGSLTINGLTQILFQPGYEPNVTLGYTQDNFVANVSLFNGGSHKKLNAIYTISYGNRFGDIKYSGVLGYVHNIQGTGMGMLKQSKNSATGDKIISGRDKNPVINFDGQLSYKNYNISGGYATTALSRAYTNNNRASAFYIQGSYSVPIFNQKTTLSVSYNHAYNTQKFAFNQLVSDVKYCSITKDRVVLKNFIPQVCRDRFLLEILC
jgi:outer membrane murein-binding lipoprotein Lpp